MTLDADDLAQLAELIAKWLADDRALLADLIAERVAQLLDTPPASRYVDAAALAGLLGVRRDWIYAHKHELGAFRLNGQHGRLRFDLVKLADRLARADAAAPPPPARARRRARAGARQRAGARPVRLIPYHVESAQNIRRPGRRGNADTRPDTGR